MVAVDQVVGHPAPRAVAVAPNDATMTFKSGGVNLNLELTKHVEEQAAGAWAAVNASARKNDLMMVLGDAADSKPRQRVMPKDLAEKFLADNDFIQYVVQQRPGLGAC